MKAYDDYEGMALAALRAIVARITGEWDHPDLMAVGPLTADSNQDILRIARGALGDDA